MDDRNGTAPITAGIREMLEDRWIPWPEAVGRLRDECDAIDAVHSALERERHEFAPESHYMMLPKDVDGVPVHVGEVMEWPDGETFEVIGIGGDALFYMDDGLVGWTTSDNKRHHREPTVEDVLCELLDKVDDDRAGQGAIIAEYASKLRLAGGAE